MSKRLNIVLPDTTVALLDRVAPKGNRSKFISEAVVHLVETREKKKFREELKAYYIANAQYNREIAAEWAPLEEEVLDKFEASFEPKKPVKTRSK